MRTKNGQHSATAVLGSPSAITVGRPAGLRLSRAAQIAVALTVAAAALRFGTLDVQSIWLDESATMILVRRGFTGMMSHLSASESAPPFYYILVWGWTKVFGVGPLGFRSFSALAGTLTVPVMYLAGRRISPRAGVWAAALTAFNPAMYYYSQEARCYALLILFTAVAFALWLRALEKPDGRCLALWAGASILALVTHYFAVFVFVPQAVIIARRVGLRRLLAPVGAVVLVGLALLPLAVSQHGNGKKSEWIEESSLISRVAETAKLFLVGVYGPAEIATAVIAGLLAVSALVLVVRRTEQRARAVARECAIVGAVALGLPLLGAATHVLDVFDGRNVIAVWIPWAVLLAIGLAAAHARRVGSLLGIGLCMLSLIVIAVTNATPGYQRDDWRGVARALGTPPYPDRVIVAEQHASFPLSIYLPGIEANSGSAVVTRELDLVALRERRTGRSPAPPAIIQAPAPPGFRAAGVLKTESYALSRFVAPHAVKLDVALLRRLSREAKSEAIWQR
jgi:4-amino-4-deoxy-L-arabinose transferase-like glycosyltransferase